MSDLFDENGGRPPDKLPGKTPDKPPEPNLILQLQKRIQLLLRERRLLSHEIHDGLIQYLIGAKMFLESALVGENSSGPLNEASKSLDKAIEEARRLISEQRRQFVGDFVESIERELEDRLAGHSIRFDLAITGREFAADIASENSLTALRILQESLSNTIRHSQADQVTIGLALDATSVTMTITDNGDGIADVGIVGGIDVGIVGGIDVGTAGASSPEYHGIPGMRARADAFGGEFEISSTDQGTRVRVKLPLRDPLA